MDGQSISQPAPNLQNGLAGVIIIISGTLYTHTALLVKILYVLVVLVISPLGF